MLTRRFLGTTVAALALVSASGTAHAAERALMGIVLGRSYRQVLVKYGSPDRVQAVAIPVPGQGNTGMPDQSQAGAPQGYGAPGGGPPGYGGPPGGSGGPAGYGGGPGMSGGGPGGAPGGSGGPSYGAPGGGPPGFGGAPGGSGGGPPVLPPAGGAPGLPGASDNTGGAGATLGVLVGNGAEWIYNRPGGLTMAYVINEDGRVAQISVSSAKPFPAARTALGVSLGTDFKRVLSVYGWPPFQYVAGTLVEAYYTKNHHASFTFVKGKLVRITIALAD